MKKTVFICISLVFLIVMIGTFAYFSPISIEKVLPQRLVTQNTTPLKIEPSSASPIMVYGYLPYWTRGKATFPAALTHISYFSLGIQSNGKLLDLPTQSQEAGYKAYQKGVLTELRSEIRPSQKLELTITMMDQEAIPLFLADPAAQDVFVHDLETIVSTQPISGVNIDIEYNGVVDAKLQDQLTLLVHRANVLLKNQKPPLSLSIATYSDAGNLQRLTNLKSLAPEVDHIIMMAYDYHRSNSPNAGPNSPLYGKAQGKWAEDIMNNLHEYTQFVPSEKIILGVPFYGYAWSVEDESNPNSFTLPKTGESVPYGNILKIISRKDVERYWDNVAYAPYLRYKIGSVTKILYYDDPTSLQLKTKLVEQAHLGGIAIWALGYDEGDPQLWNALNQTMRPE